MHIGHAGLSASSALYVPMVKPYADAQQRLLDMQKSGTVSMAPKAVVHTDMNRSDHESFIARNIPAVLITEPEEMMTPAYHGHNDTCETVDIGYLRMTAELVTEAVVAQLK